MPTYFTWCLVTLSTLAPLVPLPPASTATVQETNVQSALVNFEGQFHNKYFSFDLKAIQHRGPEWPAGTMIWRRMGICKNWSASQWQLETTLTFPHPQLGSSLSDFESPVAISEVPREITEVYGDVIGENYTARVKIIKNDGSSMCWGTVKSNQGRLNRHSRPIFHNLSILFGRGPFMRIDGVGYASLDLPFGAPVREEEINDMATDVYIAQSDYGKIRVWIGKKDGLLHQLEHIRRHGDWVIRDLDVAERAPRYRIKTGPDDDSHPGLQEIRLKYTMRYSDAANPHCIGFNLEHLEKCLDGSEDLVDIGVTISNVRPVRGDPPKLGNLQFETLTAPDGERFHADDDPGIPYVVDNGRIAKVVNDSMLKSLDGERYEWSQDSYFLWYLAGGLVVLICGAVIVWRTKLANRNK